MKLIHDRDARRFRLPLDGGGEAHISYTEREAGTLDLRHTEVPPAHRGDGVASELVEQVLTHVREEGLRIVPSCPFVAAYIRDHPEHASLVA